MCKRLLAASLLIRTKGAAGRRSKPKQPHASASSQLPPAAGNIGDLRVNIFLLCYNQQVMLPKTWAWYKSQFPSATLYLMDNFSTDRTIAVARLLGMSIIKVGDDRKIATFNAEGTLHNTIWRRYVEPGTWVITADMDELMCVTQEHLEMEDAAGTTVLRTEGFAQGRTSTRSRATSLPTQ